MKPVKPYFEAPRARQVSKQVWNQSFAQVWDQVKGEVREQVWNQAGGQVYLQLRRIPNELS